MEMEHEDFLKEKEKIEKLSDPEQKEYYMRWLETHTEKTAARVAVYLNYARILYQEGDFRGVIDALLPVTLNRHAYPFCEEIVTCYNQMGLAVNCESEYSLARHYFQMALTIAEEHQITSVYAKQHNNIGLTYYDQRDFESAIREYELGEKYLPESCLKEIITPMIYGNWINALISMQRYSDGLKMFYRYFDGRKDVIPEEEDMLCSAMILYYKTGMTEQYQLCKHRFLSIFPNFGDYVNAICQSLLENEIDTEDQSFVNILVNYMDFYMKNNLDSGNWYIGKKYADTRYKLARKEGDTTAMMDAIQLKLAYQDNAINGLQKKRLDALNEYLEISTEKQYALEKAEEATRAKSQFLSNMSHDIRTPMNAIFGITQLLEHDKNNPEKLDDYIQKLKFSSQHLLSLINDVLDMSKIESQEVTLNREYINLADQVAQLKSIICPQMEDKNQKFTIRIHGIRHENLVGDAVRLRQILINLLSNAVKYTPNGGAIIFELTEKYSVGEKHASFEFSVTDTGYGMSKEFTKHIFEPFTRAVNSATNKIQGTGLGMSITKNIVDLMGGEITLESELGKGSCFKVNIPLDIAEEAIPLIPVKQVLLITQEEPLIDNLTVAFQEVGIQLQTAESVEKAEQALRENHVEMILLTGHYNKNQLADTVCRLQKEASMAQIVFCLNYDQREVTYEELSSCGISKVVTRPVFLTELAAVLHQSSDTEVRGETDGYALQGMKFLCAEDNELNAEILEAILEMEGASCTILPDGKQVVEKFESVKQGDYDAVLMDMQMPVMNGLEATRAIRHGSNPLGRTIPIIAMTANAFSSDVQDCLDVGMDAHLSKPLDIEALKRTVKTLTGQMYSGGGTTVRRKKT